MAVTARVADRIYQADVSMWQEWNRALSYYPEDPFGASARVFGSATALVVQAIPHPYYNRVMGLRPADAELIPSILRYYSERETPLRIDTSPFSSDVELLRELYAEGCRPVGFKSTLYGSPIVRPQPLPSGVSVREVRPDEIETFAQLYERAYSYGRVLPDALRSFRRASIVARYLQPRWRFYMAIVDGMPAAGAIMHVRDDVAALAGGATLPSLRGRGCQRALLLHRLTEAADFACDLVVSTCSVGSISQNNMERCGLTTAYTSVIWERGINSRIERRRLPMDPWLFVPRSLEEAS